MWFTPDVQRSETQRFVPERNTRGQALVAYRNGWSTVSRRVAMTAGHALSADGYDVTVAIARPDLAADAARADLLVVVAPTFMSRLASAVARVLSNLPALPATRTIAITTAASDTRALNQLCVMLRSKGAAVIAAHAFGLTIGKRFDGQPCDQRIAQLKTWVTYWITNVVRPLRRPPASTEPAPVQRRLRLVPASPPGGDRPLPVRIRGTAALVRDPDAEAAAC